MKQRIIKTADELVKASQDLLGLTDHLPVTITITQGTGIRTAGQNARHWATIRDLLERVQTAVSMISMATGYTPAETKRVVAAEMPPEHVEILYARTEQAVHDALKAICDIPTSTRLGTKEFSKFDEILEATIFQIIGEINAVERLAA